MVTADRRAPFDIAGETIAAGERRRVDIPVSLLSNHTGMNLSVEVFHGRTAGPVMFVSGAVHGDEIIGVEIIRRLAREPALKHLAGTLLLIPIVNAYGFISNSRYLPDRRDLNRSFPGSATGSLASQLAHIFMREVVARSSIGIDLHSGAVHRANLPQIRARLDDERLRALAASFGAPIVLNADFRDGSLRQAAQEEGCSMLLYEAGEALRFDEKAIRIGVRGVLNVMRSLGMTPRGRIAAKNGAVFSAASKWVRAPIGGIMRSAKTLGQFVGEGELLATVSDPFGAVEETVCAVTAGLIIGRSNLPIVNRGDALFHLARIVDPAMIGDVIKSLENELDEEALVDGFSIV